MKHATKIKSQDRKSKNRSRESSLPMLLPDLGGRDRHRGPRKRDDPGDIDQALAGIGVWVSELDLSHPAIPDKLECNGKKTRLNCGSHYTLDEIREATSKLSRISLLERYLNEKNPLNVSTQERLIQATL